MDRGKSGTCRTTEAANAGTVDLRFAYLGGTTGWAKLHGALGVHPSATRSSSDH